MGGGWEGEGCKAAAQVVAHSALAGVTGEGGVDGGGGGATKALKVAEITHNVAWTRGPFAHDVSLDQVTVVVLRKMVLASMRLG